MDKGEGSNTGIVALVVILIIVIILVILYATGGWPFANVVYETDQPNTIINDRRTVVEDTQPDTVVNEGDQNTYEGDSIFNDNEPDSVVNEDTDVNIFTNNT